MEWMVVTALAALIAAMILVVRDAVTSNTEHVLHTPAQSHG